MPALIAIILGLGNLAEIPSQDEGVLFGPVSRTRLRRIRAAHEDTFFSRKAKNKGLV